MSQHDMTVDNAGAATVRVDINSGLQALASTNSGASEPATMFANQLWYDTANSTLKKRNADNDAWIDIVKIDEANDQVDELYVRTLIDALVDNTADVGSPTRSFKDIYMQGNLYFDNDNSRTQKHYTWVPLSKGTASTSASVEMTLPSGYDQYKVELDEVLCATNGTRLLMTLSNDGGSTFESGAGAYRWHGHHQNTSTISGVGNTSDNEIEISALNLGNVAGEGIIGQILIDKADASGSRTMIDARIRYEDNSGTPSTNKFEVVADRRVAEVNDAIQFLMNSGNISSGDFILYGKKFI